MGTQYILVGQDSALSTGGEYMITELAFISQRR